MSVSDTQVAATEPPLHEQVGDSTAILLEAPSIGSEETEGCLDLLTGTAPSRSEAMCITATRSPDDWFDKWHTHVGVTPAKTWFVTTDDAPRSTATERRSQIATPDGRLRIDTVSSAGDLTGLGVAATEQLTAYQETGSDRPLSVCVNALDTLLQYADTQQVFRFVHVLTGQIESAGGVAHYHLDPAAHDEKTINTFRTLFDAVVSDTEDDGWTVRTR